jgi:hypothetical protein
MKTIKLQSIEQARWIFSHGVYLKRIGDTQNYEYGEENWPLLQKTITWWNDKEEKRRAKSERRG